MLTSGVGPKPDLTAQERQGYSFILHSGATASTAALKQTSNVHLTLRPAQYEENRRRMIVVFCKSAKNEANVEVP